LTYSIGGDGSLISDKVRDEQNATYSPAATNRFRSVFDFVTSKTCGLDFSARTTHQAQWSVWIPGAPGWASGKDTKGSVAQRLQTDLCPAPEEEAPDEGAGNNGGGGTTGGWVTMETCHYWAHYVNGVLVDIELRYCTYDQIPIAEE
jgi:hypothetical protein